MSRIYGLPAWASTARFDIAAKADDAPEPSSIDRLALMLRALLSERFALQARTEVRQVPIYELQVDRTDRRLGPSLTITTRPDCGDLARGRIAADRQRPADDPPCGIGNGFGIIEARGVPVGRLAEALGRFADRPVIDRTGLSGLFDADLRFRQDASPVPGVLPEVPVDLSSPAVFTAVREQLGLRLTPGRGPVDVLVVSSIAQPSPD